MTRNAIEEYGFSSEEERNKVQLIVKRNFIFKGDETAYIFTLFNLVKNALYYFPQYPEAFLTITVEDHRVIVKDTGPGMPRQVLEHLFEAFRTTGKAEGTGLGLAYCYRAMQAFKGDIRCDSVEGQYTAFTLQFPVIAEQELAAYKQTTLAEAQPVLKAKRILIVDDDESARLMPHQVLSSLGAQIEEAENGQIALERLKTVAYDLVLMDINMPVLDGYATVQKIRSGVTPLNQSCLIVAFSSEPVYAARLKARKAGMNLFLSKPCEELELVTTLKTLFENNNTPKPVTTKRVLESKRILLADDDESNREVIRLLMERRGAQIIEAACGQAALECVEKESTLDAMIVDLNMPGMGGLEMTQAIRARTDALRDVPILALTGYSDDKIVQTCLQAGMNEIILKPAHIDKLCAALVQHFRVPVSVSVPATKNESTTPFTNKNNVEPNKFLNNPLEGELLEKERLENLKELGLLNENFLRNLEKMKNLVSYLGDSFAKKDAKEVHDALHLLLGMSGNMGALALHNYVRQVYPAFMEGQLPDDEAWLEQINLLSQPSFAQLEQYYARA